MNVDMPKEVRDSLRLILKSAIRSESMQFDRFVIAYDIVDDWLERIESKQKKHIQRFSDISGDLD